MDTALLFLFAANLSLLFMHEMDAVRNGEWRMFVVLKNMEEKKAYRVFLMLHFPLYTSLLLLLLTPSREIAYYIVYVFLIAHALIHFGFRHHPNNKFQTHLSNTIIYLTSLLSVLHLAGIILLS